MFIRVYSWFIMNDIDASGNGGTPSLLRMVFHVVKVADGVGVGVGDEAKPVVAVP